MLEYDHFTLVATVRRLYDKIQELGGWDLEVPEMDYDGLPIAQSIADRLGCLSRPKELDSVNEKWDYSRRKLKVESPFSDSRSVGEDDHLEGDLNLPESQTDTVSPLSICQISGHLDRQCLTLPQENLPYHQYQEYIPSSHRECDISFRSSDEMQTNAYIPMSTAFIFQEDVCSVSSTSLGCNGWPFDRRRLDFSTSTVNPAMLQNPFGEPNIYLRNGGP